MSHTCICEWQSCCQGEWVKSVQGEGGVITGILLCSLHVDWPIRVVEGAYKINLSVNYNRIIIGSLQARIV